MTSDGGLALLSREVTFSLEAPHGPCSLKQRTENGFISINSSLLQTIIPTIQSRHIQSQHTQTEETQRKHMVQKGGGHLTLICECVSLTFPLLRGTEPCDWLHKNIPWFLSYSSKNTPPAYQCPKNILFISPPPLKHE